MRSRSGTLGGGHLRREEFFRGNGGASFFWGGLLQVQGFQVNSADDRVFLRAMSFGKT